MHCPKYEQKTQNISVFPPASTHLFYSWSTSNFKTDQFPTAPRRVFDIGFRPSNWRGTENGGAQYSPLAAPPAAPQRRPNINIGAAPHSANQSTHFQPPASSSSRSTKFPSEAPIATNVWTIRGNPNCTWSSTTTNAPLWHYFSRKPPTPAKFCRATQSKFHEHKGIFTRSTGGRSVSTEPYLSTNNVKSRGPPTRGFE